MITKTNPDTTTSHMHNTTPVVNMTTVRLIQLTFGFQSLAAELENPSTRESCRLMSLLCVES